MIIHHPDKFVVDDHTVIWAKFEYEKENTNLPEILWFKIPNQYAHHLPLQNDAFLTSGLIAGMYLGEKVEVRGQVSPTLAYNLTDYQHALCSIYPKLVQPVEIKYETLKPIEENYGWVGASFSGGADSMFTLWRHLPPNQLDPDFQVTHCLFIQGFDIGLNEAPKYRALFNQYKSELKKNNVELIDLETNLAPLMVPHMDYTKFYNSILASCVQIFGGYFKRFYLSSSRDFDQLDLQLTQGPLTDRLLSTDTLDLIHVGATHSRVEKIRDFSDWDFAHRNLRVCNSIEVSEGYLNCGRCEKCVRTLIPIYSIGKMDKFKTFAKPLQANWEGLWWARKYVPPIHYGPEMVPFVKKYKKDFAPWIRAAVILGHIRYWIVKNIPQILKKALRRYGYFVDVRHWQDDFEDPEIIDYIETNYLS